MAFYSINLFAAGPVVELKAQSPMEITNVSEGDYKLPEYAMSSWYLYLPVPLLKVKSYRLLVDLTSQNGKMLFNEDFL